MADDRHLTISSSMRLTPEEVQQHAFATVRRGLDPGEVRGYLELVARELAAAVEREVALREQLADAEHRAAHPEVDEETLTAVLGQETTRVLRAARDAAADLVQRAEEEASRTRAEAQEQADTLAARARQRADEELAQSERDATETRRRAHDEATAKLDQARAEADALVAQARADCRAMVHEAQELRAKVLADLSRRRRSLHSQIDQLRAGRERLAQTIEGVRQAVDEVADELLHAEDDARAAADEAARVAATVPAADPDADVEALWRTEGALRTGDGDPAAADEPVGAETLVAAGWEVEPARTASVMEPHVPARPAATDERAATPTARTEAAKSDQPPTPGATAADGTSLGDTGFGPTGAGADGGDLGATDGPVGGERAGDGVGAEGVVSSAERPGQGRRRSGPFKEVAARPVEIVGAVPASQAAPPVAGGPARTGDRARGATPADSGATPADGAMSAGGATSTPEAGAASASETDGSSRSGKVVAGEVDELFARLRAARGDATPEGAPAAEGVAAQPAGVAAEAGDVAKHQGTGSAHGAGSAPAGARGPARGESVVVTPSAEVAIPPAGGSGSGSSGPGSAGSASGSGGSGSGSSGPGSGGSASGFGGSGSAAPGVHDDGPAVRILREGATPRPRRAPAGANGSSRPAAAAGGVVGADEPDVRGGEPLAAGTGDRSTVPAQAAAPVDGGQVAGEGEPGPSGGQVAGEDEPGPSGGQVAGEDEPGPSGGQVEDGAVLVRRDDLIRPVVAGLGRRLKRTLQDDQNDVLDRLRSRGGKGQPAPLLPDEDEHLARYVDAVLAHVEDAARAGAGFTAGGDGAAKPDAATVDEVAGELAMTLVISLRRRLQDADGSADDQQATERVGAAFREWKGSRVEALAADHVVAAFSRAAMAAAPAGAALRWVVDDDGGACADCDDNALAGPTAAGEEFPTGHRYPPVHAGCRCLLVVASP